MNSESEDRIAVAESRYSKSKVNAYFLRLDKAKITSPAPANTIPVIGDQ